MTEQVKIKLMPGGHMPEKKTAGAAAWDCYARIHEKYIPTDQLVQAADLSETDRGTGGFGSTGKR